MARHLVPFATLLLVMTVTGISCSSSKDASETGSSESEAADIDNCSLVTDEEASRLADTELKHDEDSPLGCPFVRPGRSMGEFIVRAFEGKGPAKDHIGEHSADTTIHEISGVGDSAAVLARDEHVNFLIVQKGRRYVQFVTTFVDDINLGSPKLKDAQDLAVTALDRIK